MDKSSAEDNGVPNKSLIKILTWIIKDIYSRGHFFKENLLVNVVVTLNVVNVMFGLEFALKKRIFLKQMNYYSTQGEKN